MTCRSDLTPERFGKKPRTALPELSTALILLILLLLGQSLPVAAQRRNQPPPELQAAISNIEAMVTQELAKEPIGGLTIGIVSGPELIWTESYGLADMESPRMATRGSVYRIGSITKQFASLMLLQLVEQGKVHLTDPVEKYLPEVNQVKGRFDHASPITLVQLATMTSGLSREPEDQDTYLKGPVARWEEVMISALPRVKYDFEPDTRYQYSNIGYAILGAALSRAVKQPFTEYVTENIFAPLGMNNTAFEPNEKIRDKIAKGYLISSDGEVDAETPAREHEGRGYKVPNGAMYTTVDDLAKFVSFELGAGPENVLKRETWKDNLTRLNSAAGDLNSGYGIGFQVSRFQDLLVYGHGGSVAGYAASAIFNPEVQIGVVVFRNVGGRVGPGDIAQRALHEVAKVRAKARRDKDPHF